MKTVNGLFEKIIDKNNIRLGVSINKNLGNL